MKIRGQDNWGSGAFGASRGSRKHNGIDLIQVPGEVFYALSGGIVTKLGYPYGDDLSYRYVEVTDSEGARWRYFYIEPSVKVGDKIEAYQEIGIVQELGTRYKGITEHVHLEIILKDGTFLDPSGVVSD